MPGEGVVGGLRCPVQCPTLQVIREVEIERPVIHEVERPVIHEVERPVIHEVEVQQPILQIQEVQVENPVCPPAPGVAAASHLV